jgi:anti-sigma factor RsiW
MSLPQETMIDLMAYADGELQGDARARVEELVRTNDEARGVLDAMGALGDVVREGADARAEAASIDSIADDVIAKIERSEDTGRGSRIPAPIAQARNGRRMGTTVVIAALALAAGVVFLVRAGAPPAATATRETPAAVRPSASSPLEAPSSAPAAVAATEDNGVDLEEVSSTENKVDVFFMPRASLGAAASVVVWIDDGPARHGKGK